MMHWRKIHHELAALDRDEGSVGKCVNQFAEAGILVDFRSAERFVRGLLPEAEVSLKWVPGLGAWNALVDIPGSGLAANHAHESAASALLRSAIEVLALRERDQAFG